jgi:hypothetical protein
MLREDPSCSKVELSKVVTKDLLNVSLALRNAVWLEVFGPQGFVTAVSGELHRHLGRL